MLTSGPHAGNTIISPQYYKEEEEEAVGACDVVQSTQSKEQQQRPEFIFPHDAPRSGLC